MVVAKCGSNWGKKTQGWILFQKKTKRRLRSPKRRYFKFCTLHSSKPNHWSIIRLVSICLTFTVTLQPLQAIHEALFGNNFHEIFFFHEPSQQNKLKCKVKVLGFFVSMRRGAATTSFAGRSITFVCLSSEQEPDCLLFTPPPTALYHPHTPPPKPEWFWL